MSKETPKKKITLKKKKKKSTSVAKPKSEEEIPPIKDGEVPPPGDDAPPDLPPSRADEIVSTSRTEIKKAGEPSDDEEELNTASQSYNNEYGGHEFEADWPGRDLFVAFPCHKYTNAGTTWALLATALDLGKPNVRFDMSMGDALIRNARNRLAHRFIEESTCEWILWVDDDIIPPIGRADWFRWIGSNKLPDHIAAQHYVPRLKSHNQTLVGACYFGRQATGLPVFNQGRIDPDAFNSAKRGVNILIPTKWTGTGCMLTHRSVFEDMKKKFPELKPTAQYAFWNYFHEMPGMGEDVSFCLRAKEAGHQPYTDTGCQCLHVGFAAYGSHNTAEKLDPTNI